VVTVIAHLSDIHIDLDGRSIDRARAVMNHLENLPYDLDAVLVTGDIADHGQPDEYECARELLATRHPLLVCPGNHDERTAFRTVLLGQSAQQAPDSPEPAPVNQVLRLDRCVIAACDSSVPGSVHGYLDDQTLSWLEDVLCDTPEHVPVLVALHHPPDVLHVPYIDAMHLRGSERLAALARQHSNIAGYLCGHAHTPVASTFADRPLRGAPGVASTLSLPWEERQLPASAAPAHVLPDQPPALAYHVLDDAGRLITHHRSIIG
jgi:3',5'-cyclic AMP phosphodiesterase CpdA